GPAAGCPAGPLVGGNPDLDGNGAATDDVVHLWPGSGAVQNLRCAATAVSLSPGYVAALVPDGGQGTTLAVRRLADPAPTSCSPPGWTLAGQAADAAQVVGSACGTTGCASGLSGCCAADPRVPCTMNA